MTHPGQTFTIRNDSLGVGTGDEPQIPLILGCSSSGTVGAIVSVTDPSAVTDALGQGPLAEDLAYHAKVGGRALGMRLTGGVVGVASAVTPTRVGSSTGTITVAGAPYDEYDVWIEITKTGTLGAGEFRYTLDGGQNYSSELVIPAGATYVVPSTNLTLTFVPGAGATYFQDGDLHKFTCQAPYFTTTNLTSAITAIKAARPNFDFIVLSGAPVDAAAAAAMFSALSTELAGLELLFMFQGAIMDLGKDTASAIKSGMASVSSGRILAHYGKAPVLSAKPITGWGNPTRTAVCAYAYQAVKVGLSGDLKRVEAGALPGIGAPVHDESGAATTLDDARISTFTKWLGRAGTYITQGRIKSDPTSVYELWPHVNVMMKAARTVYLNQQTFIGKNPRVNTSTEIASGSAGAAGTINPVDAKALEAPVKRALNAALSNPLNADGQKGHVSDYRYWIDLTYDVKTNKKLRVFFKAVSLAYIDSVANELSWVFSF